MTIDDMKRRKIELGYSYAMIAELSGLPLGTVQKILGGITKAPRKKSLDALRAVLEPKEDERREGAIPDFLTDRFGEPVQVPNEWGAYPVLKDNGAAYKVNPRTYTMEEFDALPEGTRAELIDGRLYAMAAPTRSHQKIVTELLFSFKDYIRGKNGKCEVYPGPFAIYLDDGTNLQPDLSIICDLDKLDEKGCHGGPDLVIEVISPSSKRRDRVVKLLKYRTGGIREYWVVYPDKRIVLVYLFATGDTEEEERIYSFEDPIPCHIFPGHIVRMADLI